MVPEGLTIPQIEVTCIKLQEIKKESLTYLPSCTHDALRHFTNILQTRILRLKRMCPTWPSTLGRSIQQLTVCCASSWSSAGNLSRNVIPTLGCFTVVQRNLLSTRPTCRYEMLMSLSAPRSNPPTPLEILIPGFAQAALGRIESWIQDVSMIMILRKLQRRVLNNRMENCNISIVKDSFKIVVGLENACSRIVSGNVKRESIYFRKKNMTPSL